MNSKNNKTNLINKSKEEIDLELFEKRSEAEFQRDKKKWTHRRRMAYISLVWLIIMTIYIFVYMDVERISALTGFLEWVYLLFSSIPLTYLGVATYSEIKQSKG